MGWDELAYCFAILGGSSECGWTNKRDLNNVQFYVFGSLFVGMSLDGQSMTIVVYLRWT